MPSKGDTVLGMYTLEQPMASQGGMSELWSARGQDGLAYAVKYCAGSGNELLRFEREARLMLKYSDSDKVVKIVGADVQASPPFLVMPKYDGNLLSIGDALRKDMGLQETVLLRMCECVGELHARGDSHRDIKPENFLVQGAKIVLADFGLGVDLDSATRFTSSRDAWFTFAYAPPETTKGGFKSATPAFDIYMLGKSFYRLLTDRDPFFLDATGVNAVLHAIIEHCCEGDPSKRYQSTIDLRQAIMNAYDVLLGRVKGATKAQALLDEVQDRLRSRRDYDSTQVRELVTTILALTHDDEKDVVLQKVESGIFRVVTQPPLDDLMAPLLRVYAEMTARGKYGWSFAEIVAKNMFELVLGAKVLTVQFEAFCLSVEVAKAQNRFAAMETCRTMLESIEHAPLALRVAEYLSSARPDFLLGTSPSSCRSPIIADALRALRGKS
jgi:eukaryotic-like serine/threonine-protein kinase